MKANSAVEDYLKAIYRLQRSGAGAAAKDIGAAVGVSAASVTSMLKKLARLRMVEYTPYRAVTLTTGGEQAALEIIRHHRLLELFLQEILGYSLSEVHGEADRLEHTISEELEERIAQLLGNPSHDPHGEPIPNRQGLMRERRQLPLAELAPRRLAVLTALEEMTPEQLDFLEEIGLVPRAEVTVEERRPVQGTLVLGLAGGRRETLGLELAARIMVAHPEEEEP